ncbi:MAG: dihydrofolate reductase family protein [Candidatus Odinarchaeota archaeon]
MNNIRKIIASEFYSLDGFISDPDDSMDWVLNSFDPELGKYEDELYEQADTLLLGRVTYKIFESYWPTAATNPNTPEGDIEMAHKINNITKIVFSKSLKKVNWKNSKILNEIDPKEIARMKESSGKNILIVGSANIVQQLTNLGLIDEYHFVIHPIILGMGKPLFINIEDRVKLDLIDTRNFSNGVELVRYQKKI